MLHCVGVCVCERERVSVSVFMSVKLDLYLRVGRLRRTNEPMHIATVALATLRCTFSKMYSNYRDSDWLVWVACVFFHMFSIPVEIVDGRQVPLR